MLTSFDIDKIKVLHLEPTTTCNAACPQCARERPELYNHKLHKSELTLEQVKNIVPESTVANLDKMFMCGTFGDPAAAKECLDIYRWFRQINPAITLGMNTNGGLRNPQWWQQLGEIFTSNTDFVIFSIDGLADTNHIYRRNVQWQKVIDNASAYISTGASAHWEMLVFQHNQHQVDDAQGIAEQLGFNWFRAKVSKRFANIPVTYLNPPQDWQMPEAKQVSEISCHALNEGSMYIAATGEILPCCWMGNTVFSRDNDLDKELATKNFQGVIDRFENNPLPVCYNTCGVDTSTKSTKFQQQWQREVQIK